MKKSDINHLYRLLGWVRCEIGQTPEEMVGTMRAITDKIGPIDISDECKKDIVEAHDKARLVPKYIRAAVKALEKNCTIGDIVEHGTVEVLQIGEDAQSAEIAALKSDLREYMDAAQAEAKEVNRLNVEIEALRLDADRYRWLRHGDNDEKVLCNGPIKKDYWYLLRNEKLDCAIDEELRTNPASAQPKRQV